MRLPAFCADYYRKTSRGEGTAGYEIHPDIVKAVREQYAPENVITVKKPTFGSYTVVNLREKEEKP